MRKYVILFFMIFVVCLACQNGQETETTPGACKIILHSANENECFDKTCLSRDKDRRYFYRDGAIDAVLMVNARVVDSEGMETTCDGIEWSLTDPFGNRQGIEEYRNSTGNIVATSASAMSASVIMTNLDILGEWTVNAKSSGMEASYSFWLDSNADISSSLALDYSEMDNANGRPKRLSCDLYNIPDTLNLVVNKMYYIGFQEENNLGVLQWTSSADELRIAGENSSQCALNTYEMNTDENGIYIGGHSLTENPVELLINAGTLYERKISVNVVEAEQDNSIPAPIITFEPIAGGYRVRVTADTDKLDNGFKLMFSNAPGASFSEVKPDKDGIYSYDLVKKGEYSFDAYLLETEGERQSAFAGETSLDIEYAPRPSITAFMADIDQGEKPTTDNWGKTKEIKKIEFTPCEPDFNSVIFDGCKLIYADTKGGYEEYSHDKISEKIMEKKMIKDDMECHSSANQYKFRYADCKGYANDDLWAVKNNMFTADLVIPEVSANIEFQYLSDVPEQPGYAYYCIRVSNVNKNGQGSGLGEYDWKLYYQCYQNNRWGEVIAVEKSNVLNKQYRLRDSSENDLVLPKNSSSVKLRACMVAKGFPDILYPERKLNNLAIADGADVIADDSVQRYYNARECYIKYKSDTSAVYCQVTDGAYDDANWGSKIQDKSYVRLISGTQEKASLGYWIKTVDNNGNIHVKKYTTFYRQLNPPNLYVYVGGFLNMYSSNGFYSYDYYSPAYLVYLTRCDLSGEYPEEASGNYKIKEYDGCVYLGYCELTSKENTRLHQDRDNINVFSGNGGQWIAGFAKKKGYLDSFVTYEEATNGDKSYTRQRPENINNYRGKTSKNVFD